MRKAKAPKTRCTLNKSTYLSKFKHYKLIKYVANNCTKKNTAPLLCFDFIFVERDQTLWGRQIIVRRSWALDLFWNFLMNACRVMNLFASSSSKVM